MKKRRMTVKAIDRDKFLNAVDDKNISLQDLSETIGRGRNYIWQRVREGSFPPNAVYAIEQAIGLKYEDYKLEKQADEIKNVRFTTLDQAIKEASEIPKPDFETRIIEQLDGLSNGQSSISVDTTITWHLLKESLEVYQNMNQVIERMDKGQRVQMEHFKKMNETLEHMNENLESILKKTIGLEEVVYKGTKRALNE